MHFDDEYLPISIIYISAETYLTLMLKKEEFNPLSPTVFVRLFVLIYLLSVIVWGSGMDIFRSCWSQQKLTVFHFPFWRR